MRRFLLAAAVVLALAGCSSSTGGTTNPSGSPSGAQTADPLAGVQIPDTFTPLILSPVNKSTFPFRGTDGRYHLAYDLQLTNASPLPASLTRIDVVDATNPGTVIASFTGKQLVDPGCPVGDCNRLRLLPSSPAASVAIPPQESRALLIDFSVPTLDAAPKAVLHHLYGTGQAIPPAKTATPINYLAAPFNTSGGTPRVISPPLRGDNWIALNGCCDPGFPHRTSLNTFSGKLANSQRFAIDWKRTNAQGEFYTGDKTKNESYVDYGSDIYAVADGTVVATLDNVQANAPGKLPAEVPELAAKLTAENVDGNHIILDLGGSVYAMYAHLIEGSLLVKPGDHVTKGQVIAKLGNTGNANASHLHFQLMDAPDLLQADALPYEFDSFTYDGQVPPSLIVNADDYLTGKFLGDKLAQGQPRTDELPLALAIVDFPGG